MANVRLTLATDGRSVDVDAAAIGATKAVGTGTLVFVTGPDEGERPAELVRLAVAEPHWRVRELVDIARSGG